jgi:hypothetical protein
MFLPFLSSCRIEFVDIFNRDQTEETTKNKKPKDDDVLQIDPSDTTDNPSDTTESPIDITDNPIDTTEKPSFNPFAPTTTESPTIPKPTDIPTTTNTVTIEQKPSLEQMLASGQAVQYQRVACYDPEMNCEAVRSIAPIGWQAGGQAWWIFQSGAAPAVTDFYIVSPDEAARVGQVSPFSYSMPDPQYQMSEGQWYSPQLSPVKIYQNAETYAQNYFKEYTGITNIQLIAVEYPKGETLQALEAYKAYNERETAAALAIMAPVLEQQNSQMSADWSIDAAQVTLRFELNGIPCKAKVFVAISAFLMTNTQNIPYVGQFTEQSIGWSTSPAGFLYYMAEESKFDQYEPAAEMFFANLIFNEQWVNAVQQVVDKIRNDHLQSTFDQIMQQQEAMWQISRQYVNANKQSYSSSSSDYSSRVMDGWTNVITDREYYSTSDGGYTQLDSSYMHTYSDGSNFVQSNSMLDMPYGWDEVSGSTMW